MAKKAGFVVPTEARAEFKKTIQRANRRIQANLKYIKEEGIRTNAIKSALAHDFTNKRKWATKSAPLSYSTQFKDEAEYKAFMRFVNRWGEDTGRKGGYAADPKRRMEVGKTAIYKALNGLMDAKGISLEEWGGDLPPELKAKVDGMTLEQISKFFEYTDVSGEDETFDSDDVAYGDIEDFIDYIDSKVSAVQHYFPRPEKKKKKTRRKRKGRAKR